MKNEGMTYAGYRLWRILGMRSFLISTFVFLIPHFSFLICFAQDTNRNYDAFFLDAVCQRNLGNNDAAFDLLRHCVEIDSTRSEAYFYLTPYYSMIKDKEKAISILRTRLYEREYNKYMEELSSKRKTMVATGDRSEKVRTYNYPQSRVTDHRIGWSMHNLPAFMDGDIEACIEALQLAENAEKLKASVG